MAKLDLAARKSFYELTNLRTLHADYALSAATKKQLAKRLPACKLAS